jgi:hypothetical protein
MTVRHVMLERATDIVIRDLRLGRGMAPTHDELKSQICNLAGIIPDCGTALHIELETVSKANWTYRTGQVQCVDRDEEIEPALNYVQGSPPNELMLVTVCVVVEPMVPTTGFGLSLPRVNSSDYALIAMSAFVNEP